MANINVRNVDTESKRKAVFYLSTKGKDLSTAVREMLNLSPLYMTFQILIYAPLTEELIFRKSIRDIFNNKIIYAIISGIIFGGLHAITSITNLTSLLYLIPYCSLGIVFGLLYAKTDNIFSTITAHIFHNFLALLVYFTSL